MRFTKMHGIGNDYVFVNCFQETVLQPEKTARYVSDRHFGIGSDGLILIGPSGAADFEMAMYNADGSRGKMCGNGIRCVAKYVYEKGLTDKTQLTVETLAGIRKLRLFPEEDRVALVEVNMGEPVFTGERIQVSVSGEPVANARIPVALQDCIITCVSMGNPHCVIFMEEVLESLSIEAIGPAIEHHPCFPDRTNVEFVNVLNQEELAMRVWERGSGETLACGTGACAAVVAAVRNGYTREKVTVHLAGGDLTVFWNRQENQVYMTGTATEVYEGDIILPKGLQ